MSTGDAQFEYLDGQLRPTHPALLAEFAAASERAVRECPPSPDVPYGPHPRQTLDHFRAPVPCRAVVAYFHGGYWQARDKRDFSFIAPPLLGDGFDVALVNYPLCPEVTVARIVEAVAPAVTCIAALAAGAPLILIGHSAGGQIIVELGMNAHVAGLIAISGVFDLTPLIGTTLNAKLGLDKPAARAASPIHRAPSGAPSARFVVGMAETAAFREQNRRMCDAWVRAGNDAAEIVVPGADHFSVLEQLCDDGSSVRAALRSLA